MSKLHPQSVLFGMSERHQRSGRHTSCFLHFRDDLRRLLVVGNIEVQVWLPVFSVESDDLGCMIFLECPSSGVPNTLH
jgi:hypothetical protein